MTGMMELGKYSLGVGDRFARQSVAQLQACMAAAHQGVEVVPVWNKSNREHMIIGSDPAGTRAAADAAVKALGWKRPYHVDADHIGLGTVDRFVPHADFYTIDVAECIGHAGPGRGRCCFYGTPCRAGGQDNDSRRRDADLLAAAQVQRVVGKYLLAVQEAGKVYRHVAGLKGKGKFITEVSLDETDTAQTPPEMLVILAALADEGIPVQTIAPKFSGRFNKGVDYVGDVGRFDGNSTRTWR